MDYWKNISLENIVDYIDGILSVEEWRDVYGFEKRYMVSSFARIKSVTRKSPVVGGNHEYRSVKERIMVQRIQSNGYLRVGLRNGERCETVLVHRKVMIAFNGYKPDLQVNHKDLDKTNNLPYNLEWATPQENTDHAILNGAIKSFGENHYNSKLTTVKAQEIKDRFREGGISRAELGNEYGLHLATVTQLINGHSWKHLK